MAVWPVSRMRSKAERGELKVTATAICLLFDKKRAHVMGMQWLKTRKT